MKGSMRHWLQAARGAVDRLLMRGERVRHAAEGRGHNVVVGPTFTYHVVNRPEDVMEKPSHR